MRLKCTIIPETSHVAGEFWKLWYLWRTESFCSQCRDSISFCHKVIVTKSDNFSVWPKSRQIIKCSIGCTRVRQQKLDHGYGIRTSTEELLWIFCLFVPNGTSEVNFGPLFETTRIICNRVLRKGFSCACQVCDLDWIWNVYTTTTQTNTPPPAPPPQPPISPLGEQ